MDQCGRLQRLAWFFLSQTNGGQFPQFVVDQRQELLGGLGVALLPDFVADAHLRSGALMRVVEGMGQSVGDYYLVWPAERPDPPSLASFRTWLSTQLPQS